MKVGFFLLCCSQTSTLLAMNCHICGGECQPRQKGKLAGSQKKGETAKRPQLMKGQKECQPQRQSSLSSQKIAETAG